MTPDAADAVLRQLASEAFAPDRPDRVGVAVSGGGDSMAALHLLAEAGWRVEAVTVDHRLRPESAAEARFVAAACSAIGVAHSTLAWEPRGSSGNLLAAASRARRRLIADWAAGRGIGHVALGHTGDDIAETFLMELAREAGLDGLSAMRPRWTSEGLTWHRPFLACRREELRGWLVRRGIAWVEDPTNEDRRFQRVRARRALGALAPLGITAAKLAGVARHLSSVRQALDAAVAEASGHLVATVAGELSIDRAGLLALPEETARRLLVAALVWVSSAAYPPRGAEVVRLAAAIRDGRDATLAGCRVRTAGDRVTIGREPRAVAGARAPSDRIWDGRWVLDGPHADDLEIRALGGQGLRACPGWRAAGASREALVVSPAVWRGETLVAAPLAGFGPGWTARLVRPFAATVAPH